MKASVRAKSFFSEKFQVSKYVRLNYQNFWFFDFLEWRLLPGGVEAFQISLHPDRRVHSRLSFFNEVRFWGVSPSHNSVLTADYPLRVRSGEVFGKIKLVCMKASVRANNFFSEKFQVSKYVRRNYLFFWFFDILKQRLRPGGVEVVVFLSARTDGFVRACHSSSRPSSGECRRRIIQS